MNTFSCIKPGCTNQYQTEEEEAYYCPSCDEVRKKIAADIDSKMSTTNREVTMTPLQQYEAAEKVRGFLRVKL